MEHLVTHDRLKPVFVVTYVGYLACIVWLSLIPSPPRLPGLFAWDKLQHSGAYAILTLLGGLALGYGRRKAWLVSAAVAVVAGGIMEILQGTCTLNRNADWLDLAADTVGAVAVAGVALLVVARMRRDTE